MLTLPTALLVLLLAAEAATATPATPSKSDLQSAATKAVQLLDRTVASWHQQRTCYSCHHQGLPIAAVLLARSRGIAIDEALARKNISVGLAPLKGLDRNVQGYQQIDPAMEIGHELVTASLAGVPTGIARTAAALLVAGHQHADGSWFTFDLRPPQSFGRITATATAYRGMKAYWPASRASELAERTGRARAWLLSAVAHDTEDLTYRLMGLHWTGASSAAVKSAASALLRGQREDGGWSQIPSRGSDAYATGEALVALHRAGGLRVSDPAYVHGLQYLLSHQDPEGSWLVETRMHEQGLVSPPHFDANFVHGDHQMISCMGTAWATMALLEALPAPATAPAPLIDASDWDAPGEAAWMTIALSGSVAELKAALDNGLHVNGATPDGTTALMMAVPDLAKTRLLLDRGADPNLAAKSGFTPLMVTLNHRDAGAAASLLLDRGAHVDVAALKPLHGASPVFYAVWTGNASTLERLLAAGASATTKMQIGGQGGGILPIEHAVFMGEIPALRTLLSHGLDINIVGDSGFSLLTGAVLANNVALAKELVRLGAKIDTTDETSLTPLMHAASVDFGDVAMVQLLLEAGADRGVKSKDGLTALDLARKYHHEASARTLSDVHPGN